MTKHEEIDLIMQSKSLDNLIKNEEKLKFLDNWDKIALKKIWLRNHDLTLDDYIKRKRELNEPQKIKKTDSNEKQKEIDHLLNSRNSDEYIDRQLKLNFSYAEKQELTRKFLFKNPEITIKDIEHSRNIHPYWKEKKMKGSKERTQKRHSETYGREKEHKHWEEKELRLFLINNSIMTDSQLAQFFDRSIPSIQMQRRKLGIIRKKIKKLIDIETLIELMQTSEHLISKKLESVK